MKLVAVNSATCGKLVHAAIKGLNRVARKHGVRLRQSYLQHCQTRGDDGRNAHAKQFNPYDGHTLGEVIEATEELTGCGIKRADVDKGYRATKRQIRTASSSPARSAACSG
jgi:hypothetical protein